MILLWGPPRDEPLRAVRLAVAARGLPAVFLDQRRVLDIEVELSTAPALAGRVGFAGTELDLGAVTAAYLRPYSSRDVPAVRAGGGAALRHAATVDELLYTWAELTPAFVINRPGAGASNGSKPAHQVELSRVGFATPPTLVTTSADAAAGFLARHGEVIYKSISGVRSIVTEFHAEDLGRLEEGVACPLQLQARVSGMDVRVHVAGDAVFACEIVSTASDYRYAGRSGDDVEMRPVALPGDVERRCRELTAAAGLALSGIDLRRDDDGTWWCFEINPSPAFTYYADELTEPIAGAVADMLGAAGTPLEAAA